MTGWIVLLVLAILVLLVWPGPSGGGSGLR